MIRGFDWSATALGPIAQWPQSLRTVVGLVTASPVPMVILWGVEGHLIYNDAYSVFAGARHPRLLGSKVREGWPEVAAFNDNVLKVGLAGGTLSYVDQELTLHRSDAPEQVWLNLDYVPVDGEDGRPAGVLAIVVETTKRVLADRRNAAERDRQRRLFGQMPGFICVLTGPDHVYDYVNDAYVKIAGARNFVGRAVRDVFPELLDQGFLDLLDQVYATGHAHVARAMPIKLIGDPDDKFIDFVYEPIRDDRGNVMGIFVAGYDVTEVHRSAAALRRSEAELLQLNAELERRVVEQSRERGVTWQVTPDLLCVVDARGMFETTNPAWQALLGWSADDLAGMAWSDLVHPEDLDRSRSALEAWKLGEPLLRLENRARDKRGDYRSISWAGVHEGDKSYVSGRDITQEKQHESALRDMQDFVRLALSSVGGVGVWTYDPATDRFFCDAGIARLYSIDVEQGAAGIKREGFLANVHPDDKAMLARTMAGGMARSGDLELEYRIQHPDGTTRWVLSRGHTYFDESGQPLRRTGVGIETTRQRQLEEQLRQSQKMEAVGQLTGGIAHDFNNLLAGISGSLEMLETRLAQGRLGALERYIGAAQGSARRAAALTQRLLAFSRRQTLDPRPTDVNRLIAGMEDLLRRSAGPEVAIEVVGAGGLWLTRIDPSQLENALLNLCINARDAMPDGGRVTIETANKWLDERAARERELPPGQFVSVCVTDTGTGMTPEVISRAFDPFFTTKPMGHGTGLGLSMVHGFVRQSGGQVRIYSELGIGTTMCLYLPRFVGPAQEMEAEDTLEAGLAGQGEMVLVVDDEPTMRMLIVEVLEEAGYAAIEASDGAAGLRILQSDTHIALLITDVGLPGGINGRQVADAARVTRPDLKVLFITGYAENAVVGNGHLDPGMEVITKPFAMAALGNKVREMIEGPSS